MGDRRDRPRGQLLGRGTADVRDPVLPRYGRHARPRRLAGVAADDHVSDRTIRPGRNVQAARGAGRTSRDELRRGTARRRQTG